MDCRLRFNKGRHVEVKIRAEHAVWNIHPAYQHVASSLEKIPEVWLLKGKKLLIPEEQNQVSVKGNMRLRVRSHADHVAGRSLQLG